MTVRVVNSYFVELSKVGSGGAIEISGKRLFVSFSFFNNLSVTLHGGSIFANQSICRIEKSSFYSTYSTKHNDYGLGNAFYVFNGVLFSDNINTRKCGPTKELCSDTSVKSRESLARIENYNSSSNFGVCGGSGLSFGNVEDESWVKYMNIVDAYDRYAIESSRFYTIYHSNVINSLSCDAVIFISGNNVIKLDSCIFIKTKNPFASSNYKYEAVNCIIDININSMTYAANPETIFITIRLVHQCTANRYNTQRVLFMHISTILILIYS